MIKLGFERNDVKPIMRGLTMVSFSSLVNDSQQHVFNPFREGDPISLCLFLLAAESFSCLLKAR